jgi:hypothetical protein
LNGKPLFFKGGFPLPTNWEQGKTYTYTIYLGGPNSTNGTNLETNFVDETGGPTTLIVRDPDTGDVIDKGEDVTDPTEPISFTVTVGNWTDASGIDVGKR